MKNIQTHNTAQENYREAAALQELMRAANEVLNTESDRLEAGLDTFGNFTININGKSIAFFLGGPQYEALLCFINHIADENLYEVDLGKQTVVGNL